METNLVSEHLLNDLGEDFAARLRRGEHPSINDYASKYPPPQAAEIQEFLESIAMLEDLKRCDIKETVASANKANEMPEVFGRYRIERTLGEGGMGAVYLAHDSQLNRRVALKTPKLPQNSNSTLIDRFYREARSAATLHHPNICPVFDVGELDGTHYISMAYIDGHPLSDYIDPNRLPPIVAVVRVIRKVAIALQEAHSQGVVHRDLKPANIMIDRYGEPIVMDFGLARQLGLVDDEERDLPQSVGGTSSDTATAKSRLTQDGTLLGSPGYMSPEQLRGAQRSIGPASDIYSLGVVLYELLTSRLPFENDRLSSRLAAIKSEPPDPSVIRSDVDAKLASVCRRAMAGPIEDRYESMHEFAVALTGILRSNSETIAAAAVPDAGNQPMSAELVRAKEQCELVHSLYQDGQYTAALTILEKMVRDTASPSNKYSEWAKNELPRVRARTEQTSIEDNASSSDDQDDFWNQGFAKATAQNHDAARVSQRDRQVEEALPRWFYGVVSVPILVISFLVILLIADSFLGDANDNEQNVAQTSARPTTDGPQAAAAIRAPDAATSFPLENPTADAAPPVEAESDDADSDPVDASNGTPTPASETSPPDSSVRMRFGKNGQAFVDRMLRQLDDDGDRKLSKAEVARIPSRSPASSIRAVFDEADSDPSDGFLNADELRRALRNVRPPSPGPGFRGPRLPKDRD